MSGYAQYRGPLPLAAIRDRNNARTKAHEQRSKYNRVNRELPLKISARHYQWREIVRPSGRKMLEPIP